MSFRPRELLTILSVYNGVRPLGRITCFCDEGLGYCVRIAKELNLEYKIYKKDFVYISKEKDLVNEGFSLHHSLSSVTSKELKNNILGKFYGYPGCCVKNFVENKNLTRKNDDMGVLLKSFKNSKSNIFSIYTNWFLSFKPVLHLPHAFDCEPSIEVGKKNIELLGGYNKEGVGGLIKKLKTCVLIYKRNILLVEDFDINKEGVVFERSGWSINSHLNKKDTYSLGSWESLLDPFNFKNLKKIKVLVFHEV